MAIHRCLGRQRCSDPRGDELEYGSKLLGDLVVCRRRVLRSYARWRCEDAEGVGLVPLLFVEDETDDEVARSFFRSRDDGGGES
jgi:hypothetical protein